MWFPSLKRRENDIRMPLLTAQIKDDAFNFEVRTIGKYLNFMHFPLIVLF